MKKSKLIILAAVLGITCAGSMPLFAADRGTLGEAKALLQKAAEHFKSVGRAQALTDFTGKKAPWVDRDLYVACIDKNHIAVANGAFPSYVGTLVDAVKDLEGKPLGQAGWDAVAATGFGVVKYRWFNPVTGQMEMKTSFNQKLDDNTICIVGAYTP